MPSFTFLYVPSLLSPLLFLLPSLNLRERKRGRERKRERERVAADWINYWKSRREREREPGRFREKCWLVNAWSISLMLKFVLEEPCSQSGAADNNRGYTYFQKHLRLISLPVHSSMIAPWQLSLVHGNVRSDISILKTGANTDCGVMGCRCRGVSWRCLDALHPSVPKVFVGNQDALHSFCSRGGRDHSDRHLLELIDYL